MSPTRKRSADFCATHLPVLLAAYGPLPSEGATSPPSDSEQSEEGGHRKKILNFFRLAKIFPATRFHFFLRENIFKIFSKPFLPEKIPEKPATNSQALGISSITLSIHRYGRRNPHTRA